MSLRVVEVHERRGSAWVVSLVGGLLTGAVLLRIVRPHDLFELNRYWAFGLANALWCVGLLLSRRRRPYVVHDGAKVLPSRISGAVVARGRHGWSVAVARPSGEGFFLEADRQERASKLLAELGQPWPGRQVTMSISRPSVVRTQRILSLVGLCCALIYGVGVGSAHAHGLRIIGLPALIAGIVASALFIVEPLTRRRVVAGKETIESDGAVAAHLRLHVDAPATKDVEPTESRDPRRDVLDLAGDESVSAWLTRVDALGGGGAYRGAAPFTIEELEHITTDVEAPPYARLGAARLLAKREDGAARVRVGDLGERVRIVMEPASVEAVAEELEALGPVFDTSRARASR